MTSTGESSGGVANAARMENLQAIISSGQVLAGRYEILEMLGLGGMGAIYKARDCQLDRTIALKVIRPDLASNPATLQRFKREIILARQITHRNVVRIFDLGESEGLKFITMELVEGEDLEQLLANRGKLPPAEAIDIIRQLTQGLLVAHAEGVIHRDLKPRNIMRDLNGRIVVLDFGLARTMESGGTTQTGAMLGTIEYMSPEQAKAEQLDARSDLFTVGLIFYELLTGKTAYKADSAIASLLKRTQERAIPAAELDDSVPLSLSEIVSKCLEREPQDRYQSAEELLDALDALEGGRPTLVYPKQTLVAPRRKGAIGLLILAAVVLVVAGVAGGVRWFKSRPAAPVAAQKAVSVLVADFANHTGDPVFDGTLEPMVNVALEGASFVNAFNRGTARNLAGKLPNATGKLDEQSARLVALSQSVSAVITGEISRRGDNYNISAMALDAATGNVIAKSEVTSANKDAVLRAILKLVAPIRQALGDTTPESVQLESAGGAFTAASLEAVHQYSIGMDEQFAGKFEEALKSFSKAVELDPTFARAYAGLSGNSGNLGKLQDSEKYIRLAMEHVDRMTERERYRVRGYYYVTAGNWQKCIEEYSELVKRYPADNIGYGNLAGCYVALRNVPKAIEAARRAVEVAPKAALQRLVLSFYSSYGGDFATGEREARTALELNPSFGAYLALAEAQLGQDQFSQAAETYRKLEKVSPLGASLAAAGLADLASYEGRFAEAVRILEQAATADLADRRTENAADKFAALAHVQLLRGDRRAAAATAAKALATNQTVQVRFLAAQAFVEAGELAKAEKLAAGLASELQTEPQAYAKLTEGSVALKRGNVREAIKALMDGNNLLDTWIGHFDLGRANLQAGLYVEADSEFDRCIKRRGEALELFMDNVPTYRYFPLVYYYQGRVREGLKSPRYKDPYSTYLSIRGQAGEDPLLAEIRQRLGH